MKRTDKRSNGFRIIFIVTIGIFLLYMVGLSLDLANPNERNSADPTTAAALPSLAAVEAVPDVDDLYLLDNLSIYQYDEPTSVVYMYITVRNGNVSDNSDHTWEEVNNYSKWDGGPTYAVVGKAEIILQIGDETGPLPGEVGYAETVSNATIQIRGNSTSAKDIKNYKIELRSNAGEWRGQTTLDLNKHLFDFSRVRNKLAFDMMKEIPNMTSLRTQFVRLLVKDETADPPQATYVDYGLFTQIEQPNKRFLENHNLDADGQLYKATFFEFFRYPEQIRLTNDPLYDEAEFSKILEIKGSTDHSKLIQMLDDVNNETIPIEQTFEKYFNADNYFTWLAFNILMGNLDTQSQNYYLYSPKNSNTWYFLPWDYDGSLYRQAGFYYYDKFEYGVSNYWGVPLHRRLLKIDRYRQMLDEEINELKNFLTPERLAQMLEEYKEVTDVQVLEEPDLADYPVPLYRYEEAFQEIPNEIQINYDLYLKSLDSPMPYFLGTPKRDGDALIFNWGEAYDFRAQNITYHFEVSRNLEFQKIVHEETLTNLITVKIEMLEPGTYFWRVIAENKDGKIQYPFDAYRDANGSLTPAMKYLLITNDGRILEE